MISPLQEWVEEMNDMNANDNNNNDDNNNNANDPNAYEHDDPEEQEIQQEKEVNPEEQAAGEQQEEENNKNNMQHEKECKECKEELNGSNDDLREMTGVDGKLAGVAQIVGVEPEIDENSEVKEDQVEVDMDQKYGPWIHSHDLWPRKQHIYSHLHGDLEHTMLTQYKVKKSLKLFGEAGTNAVVTEMQQLHDQDVIIPKHVNMLT